MEKTVFVSQNSLSDLPLVSFKYLIKYLKEKQYSQYIPDESNNSLEDFFSTFNKAVPDTQLNCIEDHAAIDDLMKTVLQDKGTQLDFYALAIPVSNEIIYSSEKFQSFFSQFVTASGESINFLQAALETTYQTILKNFYGLSLIHNNTTVYEVTDRSSGISKFIEFEFAPDLIDVTPSGVLPALSLTDLSNFFCQVKRNNLLKEALPLSLFSLQGFVTIKVRDVTTRESIGMIKNILLAMPYLGDMLSFESLQKQVQYLIEIPAAHINMVSLTTDQHEEKSKTEEPNITMMPPVSCLRHDSYQWLQLADLFKEQTSVIVSDFSHSSLHQFPFLKPYADSGVRSLMLLPLRHGEELIGTFSVTTHKACDITRCHLHKIESLIPLLAVALEKHSEKMDDEIDRVIKEQFTAVQSSVNWKFTEAARNFISQKNKGLEGEIENIVFENVYPLYGSIDVRNSSIERSTAIQKDLLDQLQLANEIIKKTKEEIFLFSLREISFRIDKYISTASMMLFPGDEMAIQNFLDEEIAGLFHHLKKAVPLRSDDIDKYFFLLNANTNKISKQCGAFEKSITMINNELVKFINHEQAKVQEIYAHYFEYFVTDGVDFNIYIGQSITPGKTFDQFYLKNLKLWQLTTLVKAAQKVRSLHKKMPVALDTTQLILAHSKPLSISFRVAERKFDVDGAYNIHYEIIKKRIDKVKIMGSGERLTQPGKIAIVFAHDKEAQEYTAYINYLQKEGLLDETIEYFDLEELPGVRGLKALRVAIMMKAIDDHASYISEHHLRKVS